MECIYELFPDKDIKRIFTTIVDGVEKSTIKFEDETEEILIKEGVPYYDDGFDIEVRKYEYNWDGDSDEWGDDGVEWDEDSDDELFIDGEDYACNGFLEDEHDRYIDVWEDEEVEKFLDGGHEEDLYDGEELSLNKMLSRVIKKQKIVRQNGEAKTKTYYSYGPNFINYHSDWLLFDRYREISSLLEDYKRNIYERINLLENSYDIIKYECKYHSKYRKSSNVKEYDIACINELYIDYVNSSNISKLGPVLYLLIGRFTEAERCVKKFMLLNAYDSPAIGKAIIDDIEVHKKYICRLVSFVKYNPGFYQRNIYKMLPDIPKDWLSGYLYYGKILNRVPYKNSYHLYLNDEVFNNSECKDIL